MRTGSPARRAAAAAAMLCRVTFDRGPAWRTAGRDFDDCFEMGDGDRVMAHLLALAAKPGPLRDALAPGRPARHYAPPELLEAAGAPRDPLLVRP